MAVNIINRPNYVAVTSTNTDGPVLCAYNRNVFEWGADDVFEQGEVKITDLTNSREYEFKRLVRSAATGNCKFDIQEVAKVAMRSSDSAKLTIRLTVVYPDTSTDFSEINIRILRSVGQFGGRGTSMEEYDWYFGSPDTFCLALLPYKKLRSTEQTIRVWDGYPLEVWFINEFDYAWNADGGGSTSVTPTPVGILTKHKLSTGAGLTFTPTATNSGYVYFAINTADAGNNGIMVVKYKIIDTCGVYLRWANPQGGYSYWLFGQWYQKPLKSKSTGVVQKTYDSLKDAMADTENIGQAVDRTIKVYDNHLSAEDYEALITIAAAKDVWLYTGEKGDDGYANEATKWMPVRIASFTGNAEDSTRTLHKVSFEMEIAKLHTQSI